MKMLDDLTAEFVRSLLAYNPETGELRWKKFIRNGINKDDLAGHLNKKGYLAIRINYRSYQGYRLAWLIMTGEWPKCEIDHRDLNPANNRWNNLRESTHSQNKHNRGKNKNNTSGYKGVFLQKNSTDRKWFAQIVHKGKTIYLGSFNDPIDAHNKYSEAAKQLHGEFRRVA